MNPERGHHKVKHAQKPTRTPPPGHRDRREPPPVPPSEVPQPHTYRVAEVHKVTDGDTFWLYLDVGFYLTHLTHIRLHGYDTPEKFKPSSPDEAAAAQAATGYVTRWFEWALTSPRVSLWVRTEPDPDSFGRWLGQIWAQDDEFGTVEELGALLFSRGLASVWPQRWRDLERD